MTVWLILCLIPNISAKEGVNHWIPFAESEVGAQDKFASHFMISFLSGKIIKMPIRICSTGRKNRLSNANFPPKPNLFSTPAENCGVTTTLKKTSMSMPLCTI